MTTQIRYFAADAEYQAELTRRRIGEAVCDPQSVRYLLGIGVSDGWRCLDVGAGAGSIVRWLSDRVGANGSVVAADMDTRFLEDIREPNIEVRRFDITHDEPESDTYDLVHCRWLLMHLDDPAAAVNRMVRALRPGGWLLVEEADGRSMAAIDSGHPLGDGFNTATHKRLQALQDRGIIDCYLGRFLPNLLADARLADVMHEGIARITSGGSAWSTYLQETWRLIDDDFVEKGVLSAEDVATTRQAHADPGFQYRNFTLDAAWGRRP